MSTYPFVNEKRGEKNGFSTSAAKVKRIHNFIAYTELKG